MMGGDVVGEEGETQQKKSGRVWAPLEARVSHESRSHTTVQKIILTTMALCRRRISTGSDVEAYPQR